MLELNIKDGKLVVQDSGELTYTDSNGLIKDFNILMNEEPNISNQEKQ